MATLSTLQQRYLDLIGDSDGTIDSFGTRNINAAINDIINRFQFYWNIADTTITTSNGVANLPTDYNPIWGIFDARSDVIYTQISLTERDNYSEGDAVYWITYDTANNVYVFNSLKDETITIAYNFIPTDLTNASDVCVVPDIEAVSYLAASKNWIGAERDTELKREYEQEADKYIQAMWFRDQANGPVHYLGTLTEYIVEM